ncbi:hypothetical protein [Cupriavidus oxalaticus]|nr:hypothetical protein [Cupriavidus oxalaticus]
MTTRTTSVALAKRAGAALGAAAPTRILGKIIMHSTLKTIVLASLGVATAQALAGPDWDVIHRARTAAQHASASASAAKEAQLARCDEMMKQMDSGPAGSGSPKGSPESK